MTRSAFSVTATDKAGNSSTAYGSFTVTADSTTLCALVHQFVDNRGIANSLCVKLDAAAAASARGQSKTKANVLGAFDSDVRAQTGKALTAEHAAVLVAFAASDPGVLQRRLDDAVRYLDCQDWELAFHEVEVFELDA